MKKIYKFEIKPEGSTISLPLDAQPLHCAFVDDRLQMWVQGSFNYKVAELGREFLVVATGEEFDDAGLEYTATAFRRNGEVYHVYRRNV